MAEGKIIKNKYSVFMAVCFFISSAFLVADQGQNPQWKGKIEYEDGVKVIKNPAEPLYGAIEFDLEEDLSIGNEEDDNCYFYGSIDIDVDSMGNIYVLDKKNCRIQKFDRNGRFVLTIGRQGQGPGEFEGLRRLHLDNKDRICIIDRRMIQIFNTKGELENYIGQKNNYNRFNFVNEENIICWVSTSSDKGIVEEIVLLDLQGNQLKSYTKSLLPVFKKKAMAILAGSIYNPRLNFCPWLKGSAIYGHSSEYRIFYIDSSGERAFIAEIVKPPEPISQKEKNGFYKNRFESQKKVNARFPNRESLSMNEIKQAYPLPKNKPFFLELFSDEEGNVYVFIMHDLYARKKWIEFDMFNNQGYYIYRVKMRTLPRVIKAGFVYRDVWDKEREFFRVIRYKIKNWDQLRTGT